MHIKLIQSPSMFSIQGGILFSNPKLMFGIVVTATAVHLASWCVLGSK